MESAEQLLQLQNWMQNTLLFPNLTDQEKIEAEILPSAQISAAESLGIYQRSYYSRLLSCLCEQFPALCYCLGEAVLKQFGQEYLKAMPSDSYTLYELGRRFTDYLKQTRPDNAAQPELWIDFMIELAGFERLVFTLFEGPGDEGNLLSEADVIKDNINDEQISLQRGLKIHAAQFPVARYYCLVRDGENPKLPPHQTSAVALVRVNYVTRLELLNPLQYQFLSYLKQGNSISKALTLTSSFANKDIQPFWDAPEGWRTQWLRKGFFVRAYAPEQLPRHSC